MLRPSIHSRSRMPNRNALTREFASGSFSARPRRTLTRRILTGCARADSGQATADVATALMKSRRLIVAPRRSIALSYRLSLPERKGVPAAPGVNHLHQKNRGRYRVGMSNLDRTLPPAGYPPAFVLSQPNVLLWHVQPKVGCLANGGCRWIPL